MNMIDPENNFFGRRSILDLLKRRTIDLKEGYRQNIAFVGSRFIGKSSILRHYIANLDDQDIVTIYLDLESTDFDYFFSKFVGSILYDFSRMRQLPLHRDVALLMESTKKFIPQTVEEIKKIKATIAKGKLGEAFRDLIGLPEVFTLESGNFCIIVLDEFHWIESYAIPGAFQELGKKIMTQKRCLYIVSSSLVAVAKEILSEKLSLLFGHFEIVEIGPFDLKTSQLFIDCNLQELKCHQQLKNFLIDFTGGHPLYLNIICQELVTISALHQQPEVFLPMLTYAVERMLFNRWGVLSRHFELMLHAIGGARGYESFPAILIAIANGKHKQQDLLAATGLKKKNLSQKLARLAELGMVIKNGTFYYFQDKLFRYWVKYVFHKRIQTIHQDPDTHRQQFKEELTYVFDSFQIVSRKDISSRIVELFHCFDNEALHLNGRLYKLPSFTAIAPETAPEGRRADINIIRASSQDGDWFIVFKESALYENDVAAFVEMSKESKQKLQRRIIISLAELEANARLKALQERMWIWSEDELNTLLNLYDKPYIVK